MLNIRFYYCFCLFSLVLYSACAQDLSNSVWNFGFGAKLNFASGNPIASTSAISTVEGCASISDENGNLLFYTDGTYIFRSDNTIIEGQENTLGGHTSSSQSALIVPYPEHPGQFYIFTTPAMLTGGISGQYTGATYAIFDINGNGGQGALIQPISVIIESSAELLTGIRSCISNDYWIVAHKYPGNEFHAWKLTSAGLQDPVISAIGPSLGTSTHIDAIGNLRASYDGTKLAMTLTWKVPSTASLFDFDFSTGLITNEFRLQYPNSGAYGLCFSPDNSKLYVAEMLLSEGRSIYQYNAFSTSQEEFVQSQDTIYTAFEEFGAIENAPDGKMYIALPIDTKLAVIENPNEAGTACSFQINGPQLASGATCRLGLQNIVSSPLVSISSSLFILDTLNACYNPISIGFGSSSFESIHWSTGDTTNSISVSETGNYSVALSSECINRSDSIYVEFSNTVDVKLPKDTLYCNSLGIQLAPQNTNSSDTYQWNTGENNSSIFVDSSGVYVLTTSNEFCQETDSIKLVFIKVPTFDFGNDSIYCNIDTVILDPKVVANNYLWSDGSTDSELITTQTGLFWLQLSDSTCNTSDSISITIYGKDSQSVIPNVFSPNNDSFNDLFVTGSMQLEDYVMNIYNRWGNLVFSSNKSDNYWDGKFESIDATEGTYFWQCAYFDTCSQSTVKKKGSLTLLR